ncbi:MAG: UDP-N-acetylmuramoyl-L-alanyl-D-glutamate--2,6-diaminopimelate ligase [Clostridia bacterium]|nr:UDP-N-acetylmuramoyl-L-alanyl-D-glutamate--2,6-diaminopimelate ligase [Clostridia bacterium]
METDIAALCVDSRQAAPGSLFFCTPGTKADAHEFAPQAIAKGATALVVSRMLDVDVPQIQVEDVRTALSYIAANFFGHPATTMKMIGLTGTKGKTTTSYLTRAILQAAGMKVGLIGTVCSMIGEEIIPIKLTTPDPLVTQGLLRRMADAGCDVVVMEVSAHAIDMNRLAGVRFDVGAFTNLSQDHLDYFDTMEAYFAAKMRFFETGMAKKMVYNADDEWVARGMKAFPEALKIGIREPSDVYANDIEIAERGSSFLLTRHHSFRVPIELKLTGVFNVYNAMMAAAMCMEIGIDENTIKRGLESLRAVPGRVELLDTHTPYRVILDYAHSPDSLENVLKAVRETAHGGHMIALFGCGGDRDMAKRPLMGEIGGRLADYCILTSDNPRSEDPMAIIDAIEAGIKKTNCKYKVIENRREAIRYALTHAEPGDVIVLAGKGHETYQEINGVRHPFDEKVIVAELLKEI